MFAIQNSTLNIPVLASYKSDDSCASLIVLSVGTEIISRANIEGRMLINVTLTPDSDDTEHEARMRVQDLLSNFHYEPSPEETILLNATEVKAQRIDMIKVSPLCYLAWVTYRGGEIEKPEPEEEADESDSYGSAQWIADHYEPRSAMTSR